RCLSDWSSDVCSSDLAELTNLFILDSNPGPRETGRGSESTLAVVQFLESMPASFKSRTDFTDQVTKAGFSVGLAQWLAMNLKQRSEERRVGKGVRCVG